MGNILNRLTSSKPEKINNQTSSTYLARTDNSEMSRCASSQKSHFDDADDKTNDDCFFDDVSDSDSLDYHSASEELDDVLPCKNVESARYYLSPAYVSPSGCPLKADVLLADLAEIVNPSRTSTTLTTSSLSCHRFSEHEVPNENSDALSSVSDTLQVLNDSPSETSRMSDTEDSYEDEEVAGVLDTRSTIIDECSKRVEKNSKQTLIKEHVGFQRLLSPHHLQSPNLHKDKHRMTRQRNQGGINNRQHTRRQFIQRQFDHDGQSGRPKTNQGLEIQKILKAPGLKTSPPDVLNQPAQKESHPDSAAAQIQDRQHEPKSPLLDPVHAFKPVPKSGQGNGRDGTGDVEDIVSGGPQNAGLAHICPIQQTTPGGGNSTVQIKGLLRHTTQETVEYYFQNSTRSGGGKIRHLRRDRTTGLCLLSFENAQVAQRVASRLHVLDEKALKVSMYTAQSLFHGGSNPAENTMVCVEDFDPATTTEDALRNHFENPRFYGGAVGNLIQWREVTDVKIGTHRGTLPLAVVTFRNVNDAQQAIMQKHHLNGKTLKVAWQAVTPPLPNVVSLHGLNPFSQKSGPTMAEDLRHFMESMTPWLVYDVIFGQVQGVALVIFEDSVDFAKVQSALTTRPFLGANLTAAPVLITRTAQVHRLPQTPSLTEETLTNYFQNTARSGGTHVEHVQILPCRKTALVTFQDPEVCATVVSQPQVFHSATLDVRPYFQCVGLCGDCLCLTNPLQENTPAPAPVPLVEEPQQAGVWNLIRSVNLF